MTICFLAGRISGLGFSFGFSSNDFQYANGGFLEIAVIVLCGEEYKISTCIYAT